MCIKIIKMVHLIDTVFSLSIVIFFFIHITLQQITVNTVSSLYDLQRQCMQHKHKKIPVVPAVCSTLLTRHVELQRQVYYCYTVNNQRLKIEYLSAKAHQHSLTLQ